MVKQKKIPMRMCVACRQMKNKKDLIRVVKIDENTFEVDETGKKNGRGAYVCNNPESLAKCVKQKSFNKSFKQQVDLSVYNNIGGGEECNKQ